MKNISDYINDISGKRVILRVDLDVPVENNRITETFRIERQREAVNMLHDNAAKTLIVAHSGELESFKPIFSEIKSILGDDIIFIDGPSSIADFLSGEAKIGLLDNLRRWPGEEANDPEFSAMLANGFDAYVNNAFAVCHRDHASVSGIPKILSSYAGPVVAEEVKKLSEVLNAPAEGKVVIIGGAKASTKVPVIKNLIDKSEVVLVGGVVANDLLKTKGVDVGTSRIDENISELLRGLDINNSKLKTPTDWREEGGKILDIGPDTENMYTQFISQAKLVVWNGPMGMFENDFDKGTRAVVEAIISSSAKSIIGGGDTVSAIGKFGIPLDKFSFVSTGGGAMLSFLAGDSLPGLISLDR